MAELLRIFPKVYAQSSTDATADSTAQPTFGSINIGAGTTQTSSILLSSNKTSVAVGERFKITVKINTNDASVNQYRIVIDFDPSKFQVIDQDLNVAGIQVKGLDTLFLPADAAADNTVSSVGRVRYNAQTASGNSFSINRDVIEIEFQAQATTTGNSLIKVITGSVGSQLIRANGAGLTYTSNEVGVQVTSNTTTNPGTGTNNNGGGTTTPITPTLPNTALSDDVAAVTTLVMSIALIIFGIKLSYERKKERIRKQNNY